ncbi:MAG: hypothetical protein ACLT3H_12920 [Roseburia sp.]
MDYQYGNRQNSQQNKRRSVQMEMASLFLGIAAISTICLVYPALICGALAITFALLSRGGELTFSPKAIAGLILGCIGLGIVLLMFVYTLVIANVYYDGLEDMTRQIYDSMGLNFDTLMRNYYR